MLKVHCCWFLKSLEYIATWIGLYILFWLKFTAGSDYKNVTAELIFSAGPTLIQCVNIAIFQDSAVENTVEFFSVQGTTSSSSITFSPASGMLNIIIQDDMDRKSQHILYLQTNL